MLDLDSNRWEELSAAGGNARLVPELIRSLASNPTPDDWAEVWEQTCHQWTLSSCAYAAVPYLLRLGKEQGICKTADFLLSLGRIAAPLEIEEPLPLDLQPEFDAALREAAQIALQTAQDPSYSPRDYVCVLQGAAALNGRRGPGIELFFILGPVTPEAELDCPACGAYLLGTFDDGGMVLQSVDERMQPVSGKTQGTRRETPAQDWNEHDQPSDDYCWLAALCRKAGQEQVLSWIGCLYGTGQCPLCGEEFSIMMEVERFHGV